MIGCYRSPTLIGHALGIRETAHTMARTVRDTNLQTGTARLRLAVRPKPYWRVIETGLHLGYRRTAKGGGSWVARRFLGEGCYSEVKVGTADDMGDADGVAIRSFRQAQDAAREWWRTELQRDAGQETTDGPYTVAMALDAYFAERERRGSKGLTKDRQAAKARILPTIGDVEVARLTTKRIREWHAGIATSARLTRTGRFSKPHEPAALDISDPDKVRARRSTANRTLTVLKAALNHAFYEGHASADEVWRKAKPFREADAPVVRFLTADECRRLANATKGSFRDLVRAALLTGCRYGELTRLAAGDFNPAAGTITIRETKAGKPRHIALSDEGTMLLSVLTVGRGPRELVFRHDDSRAWGPWQQKRPLDAASLRAGLDPAVTFHILRHTYASTLAMRGVPMGVIAAQLGHSDTRMTERHYAHLSPNYVAATVRAALPSLGLVERSNVTPLRTAERAHGAA